MEESMSFAIRDMPLEELEKCRDVDSIYALDFLRLQYTPPSEVLEAVITLDVLDKYDRIFQNLLRTLRMQATTQALLMKGLEHRSDRRDHSSNHKIILEMHYFITAIADYCHNTAIETHWRKFMATICAAKAHLDAGNYNQTLLTVKSLEHLRTLHEGILNRILHALLLKRKQAGPRQILDEIYDVILRYSAQLRQTEAVELGAATIWRTLEADFRDRVVRFLDSLRSERQGAQLIPEKGNFEELYGQDEAENMFDHLLLRLDMSGYWGRRAGRAGNTDFSLRGLV